MLSKASQGMRGFPQRGQQSRRLRQRNSSRRRLRVECLEARRVLATLFWQGDVDTDWSTVGNWADDIAGTDTGSTPANDDVLIFNTNTVDFNSFTADNNIAGLSGIEIQIVDDSAGGDFTLGGAVSVGVSTTGDSTIGITNSGSDVGGTTINTPLSLSADATVTNNVPSVTDSLNLDGDIDTAGNRVTVAGAGQTSLQGLLSGTGGLSKNDTGVLQVRNGANSYEGTTVIDGGELVASTDGTLGSIVGGTIVNGGGTLSISQTYDTLEPLMLAGGSLVGTSNAGTYAGPITLSSASEISASADNTFEVTGVIDGGSDLSIGLGLEGTVVLSADNTYTGATNVSTGTLLVNGSTAAASTVTVFGSATLGGTGNVAGAVNIQSGGTISPGLSPGIIMTGNLDLMDGSNFDIEIEAPGNIAGTDYDLIEVTGSVTIGSVNFNLSGTEIPAFGDEFIVINNDGAGDPVILGAGAPVEGSVVGSLNGVPLQISYVAGDGNDLSLSVSGTLFWQGDVDSNWSTVGNWADDLLGTDTGRIPANNTVLVFNTNTVGFNSFAADSDIPGLTGIEIQIVDDSAGGFLRLGGTESFTISANGISHDGSEADSNIINIPLTLGADTAINNNAGQLDLNGTIDNGGNLLTTITAQSPVVLNGIISGGGGLTVSGFSTLLSANNTYGGVTTVSSGLLGVQFNGALGDTGQPTVVESGASLAVRSDYTDAEPLILGGTLIASANSTSSFAGDLTLTATSGIGTQLEATDALALTGNISGLFGINVMGVGTTTLSGTNSYSGPTSVNSGTLMINGSTSASSVVTVAGGATLAGIGNVAGPVNVESGGTVSPGLSPGTIMTGDLDLMDGSIFDIEINSPGATAGTDFDEIVVAGSVTVGAVTFNLSGSEVASLGEEFIVIDNDDTDAVMLGASAPAEGSIVGTLNGVPLQISYVAGDGNDVSLFVDNTLFWQGDVDSNWNTPGNWAADLAGTPTVNVPADDAVLVFNTNTDGLTSFAADNNIAGLTGIEIQFVDDSATDDFTLGGAENLELAVTGISAGGTDSGPTNINTDLTLSVETVITTDRSLRINGVVSGAGGLTKNAGTGLALTGANTYTGTTTVNQGNLDVGVNGALGSVAGNTIVNAGGSLFVIGGVDYTDLEPVILNGGDLFASSGNNSFAGPVTLSADSTVNAFSGDTLDLTGVIAGAAGLDINSRVATAGLVVLSGDNLYTGDTRVFDGTLQVNGANASASTVTVMAGATLGGTGNVAGPVNVESGGTISPGLSPGTIMTGDLDLMDGSIYDVEINDPGLTPGTDFDVIDVTGSVTIGNATFNPLGNRIPGLGEEFVVIDNDGSDAVILGAGAPGRRQHRRHAQRRSATDQLPGRRRERCLALDRSNIVLAGRRRQQLVDGRQLGGRSSRHAHGQRTGQRRCAVVQ